MKQTLKNMRIRKWMGVLFAAVLMTALGAQTALASTDYVKSISITLDVAPVPGEDLPALHYGYTGDTGYEVKIPSNERYEIVSAEWGSKVDEARLGGTYTIKITLETLNDYRFSSSYSSSKVTVRGGDFVSAKRQGSGKLLVTVKTDPAKGDLEEPEEAYWSSGKYTSSKFGYADWEKVEDAAYDVYLYRGSKTIKKVTDLHTSSYNFYPYMTSEGTYTFRVRAVPADSSVSKYAKKSDWVTSDELYVDEDEVSDGSGQDKDDKNDWEDWYGWDNVGNQVGWIERSGRWRFRYPDGTYVRDSWGKISGVWYLFDGNGDMLTGWQLRSGIYYYMDTSGAMRTGWLLDKNVWYFLKDDGAMAVGWIQLGDKAYYLNGSGAMVTGWQTIDDQIYYFYPDGHKAVNEVIDGFYVDMNGVWKRP
mgnify:FL=1